MALPVARKQYIRDMTRKNGSAWANGSHRRARSPQREAMNATELQATR